MIELFHIESKDYTLSWRQKKPPESSNEGQLKLIPRPSHTPPKLTLLNNRIPVFFEETTYYLYLKGHHKSVDLLNPYHFPLTQEETEHLLYGEINFGSQIGFSRFTILVNGQPVLDFELEIAPLKIDAESDYKSMIYELQTFYSSQLFSLLKPTYQKGLSQFTSMQTPLEWLILLKHSLKQLKENLEIIQFQPIFDLTFQTGLAPLHRVKSQKRSKANLRSFQNINSQHLLQKKLIHSTNTPENSWLKFKLHSTLKHFRTLKPLFLKQKKNLKANLEQAEHSLAQLLHLIPDCDDKTSFPDGFSSLKLLLKPGYREVYQLLQVLEHSLKLGQNSLEIYLKDIHQLYEKWCLITLIKQLAELTQTPIESFQDGTYTILEEQKFHFEHPNLPKITLTYQPSFQGISLPLQQRPDYLITLEDSLQQQHYLLDAKYRLDTSPQYKRQFGSSGPPKDALNTLHRYRDAIVIEDGQKVFQAIALFPAKVNHSFGKSSLWSSIFEGGIGAIPLLPSRTYYLEQWLRSLK